MLTLCQIFQLRHDEAFKIRGDIEDCEGYRLLGRALVYSLNQKPFQVTSSFSFLSIPLTSLYFQLRHHVEYLVTFHIPVCIANSGIHHTL